MTRSGWRSVVLALLVVGAAVAATGAVSGQSANTYTHTWTGAPGQVLLDVGSYSGDMNIQFNSPVHEAPIWAGSLSGAQTDSGRVRLVNQQAYDEITVTVTGPNSEPTWESGGVAVAFPNSYSVGTTGGDTDTNCGTLEQTRVNVGANIIDCTGYPGIEDINTTGTDANQLQQDIYEDALNAQASTNNTVTVLNNYLNDTETTARIYGQNAYIRSLNNGSSEAAARSAAREAIADYYATKQENVIAAWETSLSNWQYVNSIANNETGISGAQNPRSSTEATTYVDLNGTGEANVDETTVSSEISASYAGSGSSTVTLVNGETTSVMTYTAAGHHRYTDGSLRGDGGSQVFSPADATPLEVYYDGENLGSFEGNLLVRSPNGSDSPTRIMHDPQQYEDVWQDIEDQNQRVQDDIDTIVNNTYSEYQAGDINNTDLQNPYTLATRGPGESYDSWAASYLATVGVNSPEALESTGSFRVNVTGGPTYEGILFVTEDITISTGTTYDSSNLNGTEYVVAGNRTYELTGTWTVESITTSSGESRNNATYEDTTYQSSNVTELIAQYENLLEEREEIEAREQALIANSNVSADDGDEPPIDPLYAAAGIGVFLVVLVVVNKTS